MNISTQFNKFLHSILNDLFTKSRQLKIYGLSDEIRRETFTIHKSEDYYEMDELKQLLKILNLNYPRDGENNVSTVDISNKDLCEHIEFLYQTAGYNGIELKMVKEEWDRLINNYEGY